MSSTKALPCALVGSELCRLLHNDSFPSNHSASWKNSNRIPVHFTIQLKIFLYAFKAIHRLSSLCLSDLLRILISNRSFRSSSSILLTMTSVRLSAIGGRAFCRSAPQLWNSLPSEIWNIYSFHVFKSNIQLICFERFSIQTLILLSIYFFHPHCPLNLNYLFLMLCLFEMHFEIHFLNYLHYCFFIIIIWVTSTTKYHQLNVTTNSLNRGSPALQMT